MVILFSFTVVVYNMPRRRYYCEYCDKSFSDNPTNRRNHLNGVQHKTAKKEHYDSFLEPEVLLTEDAVKKPCRKYFQDGDCKFGRACKYSHYTREYRDHLKQMVALKQCQARSSTTSQEIDVHETIRKWIEKNDRKRSNKDESFNGSEQFPEISATLPSIFLSFTNLPPSILPCKSDDLEDDVATWG